MNISKIDAGKLIQQQQVAHKLLAGFYQSILSMINDIVSSFNGEFKYWGPSMYGRPCTAQYNPLTRWIWDMFPMYAFFVEYIVKHPDTAIIKNIIRFELHCDGGYTGGNVDPLSITSSDGYVDVMLYRLTSSTQHDDIYNLYTKATWPNKDVIEKWQPAGDDFEVYYKKYLLTDFISEQSSIQEEIKNILMMP